MAHHGVSELDRSLMARALALAARGLYSTTPNPRVGCVIAQGERVVGEGWHARAGLAHAEINALERAGEAARGATVYLTLEPCNHHGRTPPCAEALVAAGVARVVCAMRDPNPAAAQGAERLSAAGIQVEHGLLEDDARELNIGFVSRMTRGRPWVRMKIAATLDGRSALADGTSQWITGEAARLDGHRWRARACALLTGIGTVKADDPQLSVRGVDTPRQPLRVVVDSRLETPATARILQGGNVLVFCATDDPARRRALEEKGAEVVVLASPAGKVDLPPMLELLARRGVNELHVEGGFKLNGSLVREGCVDEFLLYLNPSLLGDTAQGMVNLAAPASLEARTRLRLHTIERVGEDLRVIARR
jgi:diaminohydroxyphosphoribosylaminopyrimidine deaminase / 5-amino-6-(5-phosphoribosylamino)uracil reductase